MSRLFQRIAVLFLLVVFASIAYVVVFEEFEGISDARELFGRVEVAEANSSQFLRDATSRLSEESSDSKQRNPEKSTESSARKKFDSMGIAILTTGWKSKYVFVIESLLIEQGFPAENIEIFCAGKELGVCAEHNLRGHVREIASDKRPRAPHAGLTWNYIFLFETMVGLGYKVFGVFEDDIFPSGDFVQYLEWGRQLLESDPTIMSVSGSHDNAAPGLRIDAGVFSRADQFLGLGWITSAAASNDFLLPELKICPGTTPWDVCAQRALGKNNLTTVFPQVPRTVHVPYKDGKYLYLVEYPLMLSRSSEFPHPSNLTKSNYGKYIAQLCNRCESQVLGKNPENWEVELKASELVRGVPYFKSGLSGKIFGMSGGAVVYPLSPKFKSEAFCAIFVQDASLCSAIHGSTN